ncbi:MAG: ABC transporter permease [Oscillospiraceae bacterium]|jgi:ribose transport system permease protein|nr:ABC transporter permease [Oscillospiraceae bacterium]
MGKRGVGQVVSVSAALALMFLTFALVNRNFVSRRNVTELLRQVSPILIIGVGQSFVLITAGIDLSIGSVVGMSSMISATLMTRAGMNPFPATLITMLCCLAVGFINGTLVSRAKLPPFIATLGTMIIARGVAQWVNNNRNTDGIASQGFRNLFYYGKFLGYFAPLWIALILFAAFNFILSRTRTGRHIYAIGSNYEAAKFSGVNVAASETTVYVVSSFMACVVGLILTAMSGMGAMDAGNGYELNAVAASVIGGVSTMGGQGLLFGTVIGSCIWGVLNNGLQFAGAPQALKNIVIGVVVIISVLIDRVARGSILDVRRLFGIGRKKPPTQAEGVSSTSV